jgi:hypothetical protein
MEAVGAMQHALMNAILLNRPSLAPRWALADVIASTQPDRARFIRAQCFGATMQALCPARPEWARAELDAAAGLLAASGDSWARPLPGLDVAFACGFVERVRMTPAELAPRIDAVVGGHPIIDLVLGADAAPAASTALRTVLGHYALQSIVCLEVDCSSLADEACRMLASTRRLTNLRWLKLTSAASVTPAGVMELAAPGALPALEVLAVEGGPDPVFPVEAFEDGYCAPSSEGENALGGAIEARHGTKPWLHLRGELLHARSRQAVLVPLRFGPLA